MVGKKSYERLQELDPNYAKKLTPNDYYRLIRALEIIELTKKPVSAFGFQKTDPPKYDFRGVFLEKDRLKLNLELDHRVEQIVDSGLVEEVIGLEKQGLQKDSQAGKIIGYRSTLLFLDKLRESNKSFKEIDHLFLEYLQEYQNAMRYYAKQQWQWFRKEKEFRWINMETNPSYEDEILRYYNLDLAAKKEEDEEIRKHKESPQFFKEQTEKDILLKKTMKRYRPILKLFDSEEKRRERLEKIISFL